MDEDGLALGDRDIRGRSARGPRVALPSPETVLTKQTLPEVTGYEPFYVPSPSTQLQANRGRRGPLFAQLDCYDIALATIDFVVDHMGFDSGAEPQAVLDFIAAQITRMGPDADHSRSPTHQSSSTRRSSAHRGAPIRMLTIRTAGRSISNFCGRSRLPTG